MAAGGEFKRRKYGWMLPFIATAVVAGAVRWHVPHQSRGLVPIAQRRPMRELTLVQLDGGQWKLADHSGQVVLINYFASWCEPCRDELPALLQSVREATPQGLAVVGISLDSAPTASTAVQQYVAHYRLPYPVAFPDAAIHTEAVNIALPTTTLIDRHGLIARTYNGEVDHTTLAQDIAGLLAER